MAKITLPTNYRDDILNSSAEGKRKYVMSYNQDGTVSFEDVTVYDQVGSDFGAGDINTANEAINQSFDKNKLIADLDTINALTEEGYAPDALAVKQLNESLVNENNESFNFGYKDGVRGFFTNPSRADDSFIPFKSFKKYIGTPNVGERVVCGFKPKTIFLYAIYSGKMIMYQFYFEYGTLDYVNTAVAGYGRDKDFSIVAKEVVFELHEDGFTVTFMGSGISIYDVWAYEDSLK